MIEYWYRPTVITNGPCRKSISQFLISFSIGVRTVGPTTQSSATTNQRTTDEVTEFMTTLSYSTANLPTSADKTDIMTDVLNTTGTAMTNVALSTSPTVVNKTDVFTDVMLTELETDHTESVTEATTVTYFSGTSTVTRYDHITEINTSSGGMTTVEEKLTTDLEVTTTPFIQTTNLQTHAGTSIGVSTTMPTIFHSTSGVSELFSTRRNSSTEDVFTVYTGIPATQTHASPKVISTKESIASTSSKFTNTPPALTTNNEENTSEVPILSTDVSFATSEDPVSTRKVTRASTDKGSSIAPTFTAFTTDSTFRSTAKPITSSSPLTTEWASTKGLDSTTNLAEKTAYTTDETYDSTLGSTGKPIRTSSLLTTEGISTQGLGRTTNPAETKFSTIGFTTSTLPTTLISTRGYTTEQSMSTNDTNPPLMVTTNQPTSRPISSTSSITSRTTVAVDRTSPVALTSDVLTTRGSTEGLKPTTGVTTQAKHTDKQTPTPSSTEAQGPTSINPISQDRSEAPHSTDKAIPTTVVLTEANPTEEIIFSTGQSDRTTTSTTVIQSSHGTTEIFISTVGPTNPHVPTEDIITEEQGRTTIITDGYNITSMVSENLTTTYPTTRRKYIFRRGKYLFIMPNIRQHKIIIQSHF